MKVEKKLDGTKLTIKLEGRLDTVTAPDLDKEMQGAYDGVTELIFDMENLEYVSSAGLRVLISAQKIMKKQGTMIVKNVNEQVMEVFEVTGLSDILTIQ